MTEGSSGIPVCSSDPCFNTGVCPLFRTHFKSLQGLYCQFSSKSFHHDVQCVHVNILSAKVHLPLRVLMGPPLIAKTSFSVQPSAMLQTTDGWWRSWKTISPWYFPPPILTTTTTLPLHQHIPPYVYSHQRETRKEMTAGKADPAGMQCLTIAVGGRWGSRFLSTIKINLKDEEEEVEMWAHYWDHFCYH